MFVLIFRSTYAFVRDANRSYHQTQRRLLFIHLQRHNLVYGPLPSIYRLDLSMNYYIGWTYCLFIPSPYRLPLNYPHKEAEITVVSF